ncbi:MAG: NAD-dependent epimerase/dehydratase family protein, partial [Acidobacteriaceae bacterium]|nr:NAD-dependent epimerase/dehydratase family protein [Acidobacteriaceae bacterium]
MKAIITGAAGFIGGHAAEHFLSRGDSVIGIDNLSRPGNVSTLNHLLDAGKGRFQFHHGDIRSAADMDRVFAEHRDASLVIHEAGQVAVTTSVVYPRLDFEANATGTLNVLEATRTYTPEAIFLFASTNKVYGGLEHVAVRETERRYAYVDAISGIDETQPIDFHSPYGCSKGAAEQYVRDYYRIYGLKTVAFRQSCIYGTRQYGLEDQGWIAWFTIASLLQRPITLYGDGKQVRDVLWVDDLIRLYHRAVERIDIAAGRIYNAGGGPANSLSLLELFEMLGKELGHEIPYRKSSWRPGDQRIFIA